MGKLLEYADKMRRNPTFYEKRMSSRLKGAGVAFVCQKIIGSYIVDFFIPHRNTVLEVDGSSHDKKIAYDWERDKYLRGCGYKVIHVNNEAVEIFNVSGLKRGIKSKKKSPFWISPWKGVPMNRKTRYLSSNRK